MCKISKKLFLILTIAIVDLFSVESFASEKHMSEEESLFKISGGGYYVKQEGDITSTVVASIPTEDVIVKSSVPYVPQYVKDVYGKTNRVTKDVTFLRLMKIIREEYPKYDVVTMGTPVNFDVAPTHLTRVKIPLKTEEQVADCLKAISTSDMLIRTRVQPAWTWEAPAIFDKNILLHVAWYDTVYFLQFKDIFLGKMHCRYSAKFSFDPHDATITHYRYTDSGELEEVVKLNKSEEYANSIKEKVEFLRIFRDKKVERT